MQGMPRNETWRALPGPEHLPKELQPGSWRLLFRGTFDLRREPRNLRRKSSGWAVMEDGAGMGMRNSVAGDPEDEADLSRSNKEVDITVDRREEGGFTMPCTNDAQLESPDKPTTMNYGKDAAVILQSDYRPRHTAGASRDPRNDSAGAASGDPSMLYYDPRAGGVTGDSLWIERAQAALWVAQPLAQLRALLLSPQADEHPELHAKLKTMVAAAETLDKKVQASLAVRRDRGELRTLISEGEATGVALRIIARLQELDGAVDSAEDKVKTFLEAPTKTLQGLRTLLAELDKLPVEPVGEDTLRKLLERTSLWTKRVETVLVGRRIRHKVKTQTQGSCDCLRCGGLLPPALCLCTVPSCCLTVSLDGNCIRRPLTRRDVVHFWLARI